MDAKFCFDILKSRDLPEAFMGQRLTSTDLDHRDPTTGGDRHHRHPPGIVIVHNMQSNPWKEFRHLAGLHRGTRPKRGIQNSWCATNAERGLIM
jgi:hypothetical protein